MGAETKKCPYCAEEIKSEAVKCRYCGSMLDGSTAPKVQRTVLPAQRVAPVQVRVQPQHGLFMRSIKGATALMTFVILASVIGTCVMCGKAAHDVVQNNAEGNEADRTAVASEAPIDITAAELEAAYAANEVAADDHYKNHVLRVRGTVDRISKDILDDPHVVLESRQVLGGVTCSFGKAGMQAIASLRPGQHVVLRGIGDGLSLGSPSLRACVVDTGSSTSDRSDGETQGVDENRKAGQEDKLAENSRKIVDAQAAVAAAQTDADRKAAQERLVELEHEQSQLRQQARPRTRGHSRSANRAGNPPAAQTDDAADKAWLEGDTGSSAPSLTSADRQLEWQGDALTPPQQSGVRDPHSRPLDDTEIASVISTQSGPFQACVTNASSGTDLVGRVTVRMVVDGSGAAIKSNVGAPKYLFDHGLLKCVRAAARQLRFPATGAPTLVPIYLTVTP